MIDVNGARIQAPASRLRKLFAEGATRLLVVLGLMGALLVAPAGPAHAATLDPVADAYVDEASPTGNFGGSSSLRVEGQPQRIAYLRYDHGGETTGVIKLASVNTSDYGYKVYAVADDSWGERAVTWNTRPELGQLLGTTGPIAKDRTYTVNVSAAMTANQPLSLALVTDDLGGLTLGSREGGKPVPLIAPAPEAPTQYNVERVTNGYRATSNLGGVYNGSLKYVVEQAVLDLDSSGGGTVQFGNGDFNLGTDNWELYHIARIRFIGSGIDNTLIRNSTDVAKDTEPFDFTVANEITIKDLTVNAGGAFRSTSDAIDFDAGNDSLVENVKVTGSRARGIVFDGKGANWTADRNVVRNCQVLGVPTDGIELLASRDNLVENCTIIDVGGHGIQLTKASTVADQPNKTTDDSIIQNNVVTNSGLDGINVNSGSDNQILGNTVTNSSDDSSGRDGIRISGNDSIPCDDNLVRSNTATDTQTPKTQKYGVNISTSLCHRTVLDGNILGGNLTADLRDAGSGTIIVTSGDTQAPSAPGSVTAQAVSATQVDVAWTEASDNVGVTGYRVHRDGQLLDTVAGTLVAYSDTTAQPQTTYTYSVSALDAAGLESPATAAAPVTTPEPVAATAWAPTADAYVSSANQGTSYGTTLTLRADTSPDIRSYLRFNVSGAPSGPHSTVLRLYANSSHNTGVQIRSVAAGGWTEAVTYTTAPAVGDVLASTGPITGGRYLDLDLGTLVTGDGTYELAVTGTTSTAISFQSRETAQPPQLVLTAADAQAPSAPASVTAQAVSATQVDVAWTEASDNVGVTGYKVHRDGQLLDTVAGTALAYSDTSAQPQTTYTYSVSAIDAAGLESPATAAAPVTTPEPVAATAWVPTADAYVSSGNPDTSYGTSTTLRADTSPDVRSYLRFNVSGAPSGPHSTVLRLYASSSHNTGVQIRSVAAGGWTEAVTYTTAPAVGDVLASTGPISSGAYLDIDLGTLVTGDGTYELAITGTTSTAISLHSREGSQPPQLVLTPTP